ncbi:MAG: 16S rRNA (uracil(1498)-N(3))-methyltransferase [Desulfamplus sp.]|nr:16S rRNA (uracil(1498)-N(3))-methyltransferase [Desulfamplus sp.]
MHRFHIDITATVGSRISIKGNEARHMINVLRLSKGDEVQLADGRGNHYLARIENVSKGEADLAILGTATMEAESPVHITMAQGVLKDKKMDTILRHLTELGIVEWHPFFAKRSVPSPVPEKDKARLERWERIARESMKQCGRSLLPEIHPPCSFNELMTLSDRYDEKIIFSETSEYPIDILKEKHCSNHGAVPWVKIIAMIGPEGGFTKEETSVAVERGFSSFSLGPRILRAETASIAACALIQNILGDLGKRVNSHLTVHGTPRCRAIP